MGSMLTNPLTTRQTVYPTIPQAAEYLRVSPRTIYRWLREGRQLEWSPRRQHGRTERQRRGAHGFSAWLHRKRPFEKTPQLKVRGAKKHPLRSVFFYSRRGRRDSNPRSRFIVPTTA